MIYFTSDWHLGHERIIKYCNRPFKDVDEMNSALYWNYVKIIKETDTVYFLGDFALCKDWRNWMVTLPGYKIFLWGNHDKNELFRTFPKEVRLKHHGKEIHMTHFPNDSQYADLRLVGHVHEKWKYKFDTIFDVPMINVGVDKWDFKPVSIKQLIRYRKGIKNET